MLFALLIVIAGGMAWVRLAPDDPARWHVPVPVPAGPGTNSAWAAIAVSGPDAGAVLERLDAIALASPRTARLAGRPEEGRITWVTRSAVFGFPDYTTAEVHADGAASVLALYARARYGRGDMGVNAARLEDWIARLGSD